MDSESRCPQCGAILSSHATRGLCTRCLVKLGAGLFAPEKTSTGRLDAAGKTTAADTDSAAPPLRKGPRRIGDYELIEEIARGGMGVVFRARQVGLDRMVAVKLMVAGAFAHGESIERFQIEARAASTLQHPGIVAIHEVAEEDGQHFFSMELVEGKDLAALVRRGAVAPRVAARYVEAIADAIHYAHSRGVLHRDLKPSNILLDAFDRPRVTDFGLAKRIDDTADLTLSGQALGSPNYMPPEQAEARREGIGPASDIFSIGAILYHLLTGRPPFLGSTVPETLRQIGDCDPPAPRRLNPKVPRDLETICLKCLQKSPSARYSSARTLSEDLRRFQNGEAIEARPDTAAQRVWRKCRRYPSVFASTGVVAVSVVAVALAWKNWRSAEQAARRPAGAAEQAFGRGETGQALAWLALELREHPKNLASAQRLLSTLTHGNFALPAATPMACANAITALDVSPRDDGIAIGESDGRVRIWHWRTGETQPGFRHQAAVRSLRFSRDGQSIVSASSDHSAVWMDLSGNREPLRMRHGDEVTAAEFAADDLEFITVSGDKLACVWSRTGQLLRSMTHPQALGSRQALAVAVGREAVFATACLDGGARLFTAEGTNAFLEDQFGEPLGGVFLDPHHRVMLAVGNGSFAWVHRLDGARETNRSQRLSHPRRIAAQAISPGGERVITVAEDSMLRIWDTRLGKLLREVSVLGGSINSVVFSPDGLAFATGSEDGSARLWDAASGVALTERMAHPAGVLSARFTSDGQFLVTSCADRAARVWDVRLGAARSVALRAAGTNAISAWFTGDGERVLTESDDGVVKAWNPHAAMEVVLSSVNTNGWIGSSEDSPDGRWRLHAQTNGTAVELRDRLSQKVRFNRPMRLDATLTTARWSPNGDRVLTGSDDGKVRIWEARSGLELRPPLSHRAPVRFAEFDSSGRWIVTGIGDLEGQGENVIRIWDAETHEVLVDALRQEEFVQTARLSPDGRWLVTTCMEAVPRIWPLVRPTNVVPAWLPALAEAVAGAVALGGNQFASTNELKLLQLRTHFENYRGSDLYSNWAHWFFADRGNRPISPGADLTIPGYIASLSDDASVTSLREAAGLAPTNSRVIARLARLWLSSGADESTPPRAEIEVLLQRAVLIEPTQPDARAALLEIRSEKER